MPAHRRAAQLESEPDVRRSNDSGAPQTEARTLGTDDDTSTGSTESAALRRHAPPLPLHRDHIDPAELEQAWRLLRSVQPRLDRIAKQHGWPTPFTPARYLILDSLERASVFGLTPRRLARAVVLSPSTVAHHLDVLEGADLVQRSPRGIYDRRKVSVRLTPGGRYALQCFTGPLRQTT